MKLYPHLSERPRDRRLSSEPRPADSPRHMRHGGGDRWLWRRMQTTAQNVIETIEKSCSRGGRHGGSRISRTALRSLIIDPDSYVHLLYISKFYCRSFSGTLTKIFLLQPSVPVIACFSSLYPPIRGRTIAQTSQYTPPAKMIAIPMIQCNQYGSCS